MGFYNVLHGGGNCGDTTVDDSGETVVRPEDTTRSYMLIVASPDNTETVFLRLHKTEDAVYGEGIPLFPGGSYEIHDQNLYQGAIRAVTAPGTTQLLYWHDGR